jgi:anti-sigma-K factor RskA
MANMSQEDEQNHISDQSLEDYSRGALSEGETERLEEHLLTCPDCQDRLADADEFVRAMRDAAARLQMEPPSAIEEHWRGAWRWLWRPAPVMALCSAAVLLVATAAIWNAGRHGEGAAVVALQAVRGDVSAAGSYAPAGRPLLLKLDAEGLPVLESYRVEVVGADGVAFFDRAVKRQPNGISTTLSERLRSGKYWVRLYEPEAPGALLREYGLSVE